jgi:hypothetical protein
MPSLPSNNLVTTRLSIVIVALAASVVPSSGYSVLTHEAIIDTAWDRSLKPALLHRFPKLTPDELTEAHAYSYGGAIIQDMGYYPFSSKLFSDLVHYVRSGDFVIALLKDAEEPNEFAFALGALAHYSADNSGHPLAVNRVVPMLYPKLKREYGEVVTYEDNPAAHLRTEFGFDVLEVAKGNYAPQAYHDFIGFKVSKPLLERAFEETYSIRLKDVFKTLDLALGTYRRTVSHLLPEMTKAAWNARKEDIQRSVPGMTRRRFLYNLSRASFEKEWGREYDRPGLGAKTLAFCMRIVPKVGPFKALAFRMPTAEAEKLFMASFNATVEQYRRLIPQQEAGTLRLPDCNLDTGKSVVEGDYWLTDQTYAKLLDKLSATERPVSDDLRKTIQTFYGHTPAVLSEKRDRASLNPAVEAK